MHDNGRDKINMAVNGKNKVRVQIIVQIIWIMFGTQIQAIK